MDELRKGIAIGMLFGSGSEGHGNLMTKTATENGTYTAAEEIDPETGEIFDPPKDGYSVFTVDLALDDKSVSLTTSQITGSQTAVFEYDPHDENPELEGYSLFTIDLSGVKDDIEDLQQQVSDLEDELEDCHDCRDAVVAAIQVYDPEYDPDPDECPAPEIANVYQAGADSVNLGAKFITANGTYLPASDNLDGYNQVVVDVPTWESCIQTISAKLGVQEPYDCQDIVEKLDEEIGVYVFPEDTPINPIIELVGDDPVTDNTTHKRIEKEIINEINPVTGLLDLSFKGFLVDTITGDRLQLFSWGYGVSEYISSKITVDDATTGTYTVTLVYYYHGRPQGERIETTTYTSSALIGYGADGNTFSVKNKGE